MARRSVERAADPQNKTPPVEQTLGVPKKGSGGFSSKRGREGFSCQVRPISKNPPDPFSGRVFGGPFSGGGLRLLSPHVPQI
jgi:hypothetical protein